MARTTCPKCNAARFEMAENAPSGSAFKLAFVQCASCGTPVGVTTYYDAGVLARNQAAQIEKIQRYLEALNHNVDLIGRMVTALVRERQR